MVENKITGILVVSILFLVLIATVLWINKSSVGQNTIVSPATASSGPVMGFSSNEEMMKAHHGTSAAPSNAVGDCGAPTSHDLPSSAQQTGPMTEYGLSLDAAGYQQLIQMKNKITLSQSQLKEFVGLDVSISCCGFKTLQATGNCECGHHVALESLSKLLASKDY